MAYGFGLRQVPAVAFAAPIFIYLLIFYLRPIIKWKSCWFLLGFGFIFALFLLNNYLITGNALMTPHQVFSGFGLTPKSDLVGLDMMESNLGFLPQNIFHSPLPMLIIGLSFLPLIVYRTRKDYLLISIFISILASYIYVTVDQGLHGYGPRYLFESFFVFFILSARAVDWITQRLAGLAKIAAICLFLGLLLFNNYGLLKILPDYKNYNGINSDLIHNLGKIDLKNSLVIIPFCNCWQQYGITAIFTEEELKYNPFVYEQPDGSHLESLKNTTKPMYKIEGNAIIPYESK
jgi:small basic protein